MQITQRLRTTLCAVALAALASNPTFALPEPDSPPQGEAMMPGGHGPHGPMGMGALMPSPFFHGLKLSEAQQDKIFDIQYGQLPLLREQEKSLHKAKEELRKLALSGQYDDAKAKALTERIAHAIVGIELLRAQADSRMYQVLTDDQRKTLAEHMNDVDSWDGGPGHMRR